MKQIQTEIINSVGIIRLNNPPHNFMTTRMIRELDTVTKEWEKNNSIRAIIITGAVDDIFITHFSIGELGESADRSRSESSAPSSSKKIKLKVMRSIANTLMKTLGRLNHVPGLNNYLPKLIKGTPLVTLNELNRIHDVFLRIQFMNKPVIAAINGTCMGGGYELALACDYRIMAEGDYVIGLIEVLSGIIPGAGGSQRLARLVGPGKALEMMLDGEVLDPIQAKEAGLVSKTTKADSLMADAMAFAKRLSHRPQVAIGAVKRSVRKGYDLPMKKALSVEKDAMLETGLSNDPNTFSRFYLDEFKKGVSASDIFKTVREGGGPLYEGEVEKTQ